MRLTWKKGLLGLAGLVAVGVGAFYGYYALVKAGVLRYNEFDRREPQVLAVDVRGAARLVVDLPAR